MRCCLPAVWRMPIRTLRPGRVDTLEARLQRARNEGYARGTGEARLFKLAVGRDFGRPQALDWLGTTIDDGRTELEAQHALEREIEAWDMSCRIAFMIAIV
jgi:hypothetical protein